MITIIMIKMQRIKKELKIGIILIIGISHRQITRATPNIHMPWLFEEMETGKEHAVAV